MFETILLPQLEHKSRNVIGSLSKRERDVVRLLVKGLQAKQIGRQLGIAEATVKLHLHSIYRKLGVTGRAELLARSNTITQPE